MPELPDIVVYIEAIERYAVGRPMLKLRVASPSVLRTYAPAFHAADGRVLQGLRRIGKRIVFDFGEALFVVVHLMIAGRFRWKDAPGAPIPKKIGLAAFDFETGTLTLTEQGSKRRAGIWILSGEETLAAENRGGVEPLEVDGPTFADALTKENRTLKRALVDPRLFSGIGNAFSDEILWAAGMSPVTRTASMGPGDVEKLRLAVVDSLTRWTDLLRDKVGDGWPDNVTAFRPEMAVHGKFGEPCPRCGSAVQRIVYASNETNYCATCQTGGKLLADRSLSRLLKGDWPKTLDELEERR